MLYEMATGQQAFGGGSQASSITSIMSREPDAVTTFEPTATPTLDRVIRDCLVKDPKRRWQSAFDMSLELKALARGEVRTGSVPIVKRKSRTLIAAGSLVAVIAVALPAIWLKGRTAAVAPGAEIRFEVAPPPGTLFPNSVENVNLAISPDGLTLAFIAIGTDGVSRLWIRTVAEIAPHPLSGSEGASSIIWSPNGRSLAFFGSGKLQRLELPDDSSVPICDVSKGIGLPGAGGSPM